LYCGNILSMKKILIIIGAIVVLFIVWKLASPVFINNQVNEELPEEFIIPTEGEISEMSEEEKRMAEIKLIVALEEKDVEVKDEMIKPEEVVPQVISVGAFAGVDDFHKGSGMAQIFKSDEWQLLRLENFNVTNGPDLRVLLSSNSNPTSKDTLGEYIELGKLKGNMGNQNYDIPKSIDTNVYKSVVIYCKPFGVVFSTAALQIQ